MIFALSFSTLFWFAKTYCLMAFFTILANRNREQKHKILLQADETRRICIRLQLISYFFSHDCGSEEVCCGWVVIFSANHFAQINSQAHFLRLTLVTIDF